MKAVVKENSKEKGMAKQEEIKTNKKEINKEEAKKKQENKKETKQKEKQESKKEVEPKEKQESKKEAKQKEKQESKKEAKQKEKQENKKETKKESKKAPRKEQEEKKQELKEEVKEKKFEPVKEKTNKVEKNRNGNKKKKWLIPTIITAVILVVGVFCSTIFALTNIGNEKIINGVSIAGIDVSGLSKEEASEKINEIYNQKKEKEIGIKYEEYETTLNPTLMEVNYEVENAVEEAFMQGKGNNIFVSNYQILFTKLGKKDIPVNMTLNEEVAKQTIEDTGVNLPGIILESSYAVEEDELIITKGKAGIAINGDELLEEVKVKLNDLNDDEDFITIPVTQKEPEEIDIEKIHDEIYTEAKDAYYTKEPFTIYPEVEGIDFDVEEAKQILQEEKEEYVIKLKITKPNITIDKIGSEAFPDQLATFTTRYDVSDTNRTTNLVIACQKINGKIVLAGDTFSYNKALGPRTAAAGYRNGKIYAGGEVVDGIGGGICQISSTLYNTVLMSNLEIVERRNHQFVTSYLPAGRDATVVYGMTDFQFKNTRKYPVRIVASAKNGIATVSMYGIKEENEYTFTFSTKTIATIPSTTKYEENASLPAGTEQVKQKGHSGLKTETYMTKLLNGKPVSTVLLSRDTYDAMAKIIIKGTGAVEEETKPTETETTKTPTGTENNQTTQNKPTTNTTTKPSNTTTTQPTTPSNPTTTEKPVAQATTNNKTKN